MNAIDFDADLLAAISGLLPPDVVGREQLDHMSAGEAWLAYGNWLLRQVEPRPRRLHVSRELAALLPRHSARSSAQSVLRQIEDGTDLGPRLSKNARYFHDVQHDERFAARGVRDLKRRRDLDLLLNDWGIHHLHLGSVENGETYARRSKHVLLVSFLPDDAYAIAFNSHSGWADETYLRIMADNWPDSGVLLGSLSGLTAQPVHPTSRQELREAGVSMSYAHRDGRIYVPRGLLSTVGTSLNLGLAGDPSMWLIRQVQRELSTAPFDRLSSLVRARGETSRNGGGRVPSTDASMSAEGTVRTTV